MADNDIPLIRAYQQKGLDITVLFLLAPHQMNVTLFHIKKQVPKNAVIPATSYPELKVFDGYIDLKKVFVSNRTVSTSRSLSYYIETWNIRRFIAKGDYDLIHAINFLGRKRVGLYKQFKPWVTTVHDPLPHSDSGDLRKKNLARVLLLKHSDGVVLLNNKQKEEFCEKYQVPNEKVLVNKLGVYECMDLFPTDHVEKDPYNILFFGNIRPYKGLQYLCEAMRKVRTEVPQARLTVAGNGDLYFDINPYLEEGFVDLVNRYISMEELSMMLSRTSLCVCPYTDATQSGVIMTAYSKMVPVIASDVGGLSEMVENEKYGLLVPPCNVETLADAIISLLKNQTRLHQMSENIRNDYFVGNQSWSHIADNYIVFYKRLIDQYKNK